VPGYRLLSGLARDLGDGQALQDLVQQAEVGFAGPSTAAVAGSLVKAFAQEFARCTGKRPRLRAYNGNSRETSLMAGEQFLVSYAGLMDPFERTSCTFECWQPRKSAKF
jgi:hypothetical protein